jgi:arginine deiminase
LCARVAKPIFETGSDRWEAERLECADCNSMRPIAPDVVVVYERNVSTQARQRAAGIEVTAIADAELGHGQGGPRGSASTRGTAANHAPEHPSSLSRASPSAR